MVEHMATLYTRQAVHTTPSTTHAFYSLRSPTLSSHFAHFTNMNWSCARRTTRNAQAMHQPLLCGCTLSIFVAVNDLMLRSCGHACGICRYAKSAIAR